MKTLCVVSLLAFAKNGSLIASKFKNERNTNKAVMSFVRCFEFVNKMPWYVHGNYLLEKASDCKINFTHEGRVLIKNWALT